MPLLSTLPDIIEYSKHTTNHPKGRFRCKPLYLPIVNVFKVKLEGHE